MRKYQSYKQSGVEWIGEIPSHWNFIKTNILTENLDGKRVPLNSEERGKMEGEYPYWGSNGVVDYVNQFIFNEEIVLVGEDGSPFFDKLKDVSFYVNEPVWVNNHIHILKPKDRILPKYLTHSFNCVDYKEYITGSTRDKLTQSDLKRISHCVPPLNEQHQIVQFLDEKTELIDKLISIKESKITLLKEQRTSLINHFVTKGLNPNVKMKYSGVEWIGEIPEGWSVIKLKYVGKISSGDTLESSKIEPEGLYPVYGGNGVMGYYSNFNYSHSVLSIGRVGEKCGNVHKVVSKSWINDNSLVLDFNISKFNIDYLFHTITTRNLNVLRNQNTQPLITGTIVKNEFIPYPDFKTQNLIIEHINSKTKEIDDLVDLEQKKIDLLKEYRQSLISEVVTGKIKVTTDE